MEQFKEPPPPAIQKVIQDNTTSKIATTTIQGANMEDNPNVVVRKKKVSTVTSSLILSYNMIPDLTGLMDILGRVLRRPLNIKWLDLSNNHLTKISAEICELPALMSLYYHSNYVADMAELTHLKHSPVKFLTMHGNPFDQLPGYRMWVVCLVPQIKRLDTVLVSKLETDNAIGFSRTVEKRRILPRVENPPIPKAPKNPNEEDEDEAKDNP